MNDATILQGDCVEVMKAMPEGSITCTVTSPPYDGLRTYGGHAWSFENTAKELWRVTQEGGVICWNVGDACIDGSETLTSFKQAIYFKEQCGFRVHDTMIYQKSNGSKPNPTRYNQVFEYVFILSKGRPKVFNPIRDKKNVTAGRGVFGRHTMRERDGSMSLRNGRKVAAEFGVRGNVWLGNTRGQEDVCQALPHPAMMPKWLARDLILSWSNPGDTILDPFAGSGTTGKMALETGRKTILIEADSAFAEIAGQSCLTTPGFQL